MAITMKEYLEKNAELTRQEQAAKRMHRQLLDDLAARHRENQRRELDAYHELVRKEERDYMDKVQRLREEKQKLKIARTLAWQEEQRAYGAAGRD